MAFRFGFLSGFGAGYYLGARAGRHRYEQINRTLSKARRTPVVETAAEKAAEKARSLVDRDRDGASSSKPAESGDRHPVVAPPVTPDVVVADAAVTDVVATEVVVTDPDGVADVVTVDPGADAVTVDPPADAVTVDPPADAVTVDPGDYSSSR
jgi:hypothetical protein